MSPPANFRMLFLASLAGLGSHTLLDYTNSYGIRPFLPFDGRWFAADLVFIVDPWMLAILAGGLLLPFLFRLIHQEIGAKASGSRSGAFVALTLVVAFWIGKWVAHERAIDELRQRSYPTGETLRVGALPQFLNPVGWSGVIETEKAYHLTFAGVRCAAERVRATQSKDTLQARTERDCRGCNVRELKPGSFWDLPAIRYFKSFQFRKGIKSRHATCVSTLPVGRVRDLSIRRSWTKI